jgi:hypothetical protein
MKRRVAAYATFTHCGAQEQFMLAQRDGRVGGMFTLAPLARLEVRRQQRQPMFEAGFSD